MTPAAGTIRAHATAEMEKRVTPDDEKKATQPDGNGADVTRSSSACRSTCAACRSRSSRALAGIIALQQAQTVLIPVVLGILLSYALSPMVTSLARHHVPRAVGAALAVALLVGSIGVGVYTLSDEAWRDHRQGARSGAAHPPARRGAQRSQRDGNPPAGAGRGQGDREDGRRRDQTRGGHTSLADGTRPAPARRGRRARVPGLRLHLDGRRGPLRIPRAVSA